MKYGMRRLISLLLALVMAGSLLELPVSAAEEDPGGAEQILESAAEEASPAERGEGVRITLPDVTVEEPGIFLFGTPLEYIATLSGGSITVDGEALPGEFLLRNPGKLYAIGEHTREPIDLLFRCEGAGEDIRLTAYADFTILENSDVSILDGDGNMGRDGKLTIQVDGFPQKILYASDPKNTQDGMKTLEISVKGTGSDGKEYTVTPTGWTWMSQNQVPYNNTQYSNPKNNWSAFQPKGWTESDMAKWYWLHADGYTVKDASGSTVDSTGYQLNFDRNSMPGLTVPLDGMQLTVMVIAVYSEEESSVDPILVPATDISSTNGWTADGWTVAAGLPQKVKVRRYYPASGVKHNGGDSVYKTQWAAWLQSAGEFRQPSMNAGYAVSGWTTESGKQDPTRFTYSDLLTMADKIESSHNPWSFTLYPIYAGASAGGPPAWATVNRGYGMCVGSCKCAPEQVSVPVTLTPKPPVKLIVQPPADIEYGQPLGDPVVTQEDLGYGTDVHPATKYTIRYYTSGTIGNPYSGSTAKPTKPGKYQVKATLENSNFWGEGISGEFTIRGGSTVPTYDVTVPVPHTGLKPVNSYDSGYGLSCERILPAEIKSARFSQKIETKDVQDGGGEFVSYASASERSSYLYIKTKQVEAGKTCTFSTNLEKDGEPLIVRFTLVAIDPDQIGVTGIKLKEPGPFTWKVRFSDIVDSSELRFTINGTLAPEGFFKLTPETDYDPVQYPWSAGMNRNPPPGTYPNLVVKFMSYDGDSNGMAAVNFERTYSSLSFTVNKRRITKAELEQLSEKDRDMFVNGKSVTVYASDYNPYNWSSGPEQYLSYLLGNRCDARVNCGGDRYLSPSIGWKLTEDSPEFDPKGNKEYLLTGKVGLDRWESSDIKNNTEFEDITVQGGRVKVLPVYATLSFPSPEQEIGLPTILKAAKLEDLGLTKMVNVEYSETSNKIEQYYTRYIIKSWLLDGQELTLNGLKTKVANLQAGDTVTLTPKEYEASGYLDGSYSSDKYCVCPVWATVQGDAPTFTLKLVGESTPKGALRLPSEIKNEWVYDYDSSGRRMWYVRYGTALGDPSIEGLPEEDKGKIVYRYEGVNGTEYDSKEKPTLPGCYRISAEPAKDSSIVGSWTSEAFYILPKQVSVAYTYDYSGGYPYPTIITGLAFDTSQPLARDAGDITSLLDDSNVPFNGKVGDDDVKFRFTASVSGRNLRDLTKLDVVVKAELAGEDADRYMFERNATTSFNCSPGFSVIPQVLTIDDSGLTVTKVHDGKTTPGTLEGKLGLKGVFQFQNSGIIYADEVEIKMRQVAPGEYKDAGVGQDKEVPLYHVELSPTVMFTEKYKSYKYQDILKCYTLEGVDPDGTYACCRGEITDKPRPRHYRDFRVELPNSSKFDGKPHTATVYLLTEGLGKVSVSYALKQEDGTYRPISGEPMEPGTYRVSVTIAESGNFAAMEGKYAYIAGELEIAPPDSSKHISGSVTVPANGERKVYLSELGFEDHIVQLNARLRKTFSQPVDGSAIDMIWGSEGEKFFYLNAKDVDGLSDSVTLFILTDYEPYGTLYATVKITVQKSVLTFDNQVSVKEPGSFKLGTTLKDIVDLSGCKAYLNGTEVPGTFTLKQPNKVYDKKNTYVKHPVEFLFNSGDGTYVDIPLKAYVATFTVTDGEIGGGGDLSEAEDIYLVIYADSSKNASADELLKFVQEQKPAHKAGGQTYTAAWSADNNVGFDPKGLQLAVSEDSAYFNWYAYTAALSGSSVRPKAYVTVIPVEAALTLSRAGKTLKASDITNLTGEGEMDAALGLPTTASAAYEPVMTYQWANADLKATRGTWNITGWQMDGGALTLSALKAKAASATSGDVTVTLTPVFDAPAWATVKGSLPMFTLTITPKTPVNVTWSGPSSITYGETLNLGTPTQTAIDSGGTDANGSWEYVYYKAGTQLSGPPTDAGTYTVKAVLVSSTHSGASALNTFTIKPKSISGFTFTAPADIGNLTYNKQPHTPEYTVKDGEKTLVKDKDYTVEYSGNINAGTATVSFTGSGNYTGTRQETFTIQKLALTADQKPAISGTAASGEVLSGALAGVDSAELEWIWTVGDTEVAGCKAPSYVVKPEDSNKTITVTAKAKDSGNYSGNSGASDGMTVAKVTVKGAVTITAADTDGDGKIVAGTKLTAAANVTPNDAGTNGTWSWKVDGTVTDVTGGTYTVLDGNKEIIAVFTPGADYDGTVESAVIEVGKAPLTGTMQITSESGTPVGSKLTATFTADPALAEGTELIYTWLRDGEPIPGAAGTEYTITAADRGRQISVKVTADGYTGEHVTDAAIIPAAAPGQPNVTVTAGDRKLTIAWSAPSDNGGAPVIGYKLTVKQGGTDVLTETALAANVTSYTLENLTNGTEYTVSVKAVNSQGDSEAATAAGTPRAPGGNGGGNGGNGGGNGGGSGGNGGGWTGGGSGSWTGGGSGGGTTTTNPDGSKTTVETQKDGTVITTVQLPSKVAAGGGVISLSVQDIRAPQNIDRAPVVIIETSGVNGVKVNIPVVNHGPGIVAVRIMADGTGQIIKNTVPTQDGIAVRVNSGDTLKILDNRKTFADMKDHWAVGAVDFVSSRKLFFGTTPSSFSPDSKLTRGMLVTVLARYENVDTEGGAAYYEKGAAWAKANGLSDGLRMDAEITREQLVTILYRYCILKNKLGGESADLSGYKDADRIDLWAHDAMSWAVGVGLIKGTTQTTLDPKAGATRAQVAVIIMRYAEIFGL